MQLLKAFVCTNNSTLIDLGLCIVRISVGIIYIVHGYLKLTRGLPEWQWTGEQMAYLGIHFFPVFWGLAAVAAELFGGIALTIGFGTRIAAMFLAFAMFVAVVMHVSKGDSWGYVSYPMVILLICLGLCVSGSGTYSLDYLLCRTCPK